MTSRESARPTRLGGLWAHRNFRSLLIGETASRLGMNITAVLLPLLAVDTLHASPWMIGLLTAAPWVPWLVIGLPAGAWVDRLPRRSIMLCCNLISAVLLLSVPVAWWLDALNIWHVLAVAFLTGTTAVFFSTAYSAYLPSLVDKADLMEGNAKLQAAEQTTRVAGPGAGGLIAQFVGSATGLLFEVLSFLVSTVCLLSIRAVESRPARQPRPILREIADGLRFVTGDRYVRAITVFGAALNMALAGYQATQIVFLVRTVGASPSLVGILMAFGGVGGILGGLAAARLSRRLGTARALLYVQLVAAPFVLLIPLTHQGSRLALFAIGSTMMMAGVVACNVIIVSFRQSYCPTDLIGRVTATTMFVNFSTIPAGALLGGAMNTFLGLRPTMWVVCLGLCATSSILLSQPLRGLRDLPISQQVPAA
ncbi:MFS transporter [Streptomyces sp. SCSIO 30461]|uniref:MFS transporter n=1 Tax=Streptomyces sp. SCSIO 30461 TaxID=3118085 RepID=UPI0030CDFDBE